MKDKNLIKLTGFLLLKTFVILCIILFGKIDLSPDEAQYWTWSKTLDVGYYSKPPGIAWEIFLGTGIFQDNVLGVRFFALIIGLLIPIATYFLSLKSNLSKRASYWSAMMMAFSPIGFAASFLATTDGGMVLFMVLGMLVIARGLKYDKNPDFVLLGLIIAFGALFKWPIYLLWVYPLCVKQFWGWSLIFGVLISILGLLPSFIWNLKHDFGTFRHVFSTVKGADSVQAASQSNFFEFIGAQAGLVSPVLFVLLVFSFIYLIRNRLKIPSAVRFCLIFSVSILALFTIIALFKKMQGNWAVFAYPSAFVCTAFVMIQKKEWGEKWIKIGIAVSIFLISITVSIPLLQVNGVSIPYRLNAFRHNMGWDNLAKILKDVGYNSKEDFLFGDKYQMSSILSFYNEGQKRAYFLNLNGIRKNQFSYWTSMKEAEIGKTGYFVVTENSPHLQKDPEKLILHYQALLNPYFKHVEYIGMKPLFTVSNQTVKGAFIFKCVDYNGLEPLETHLY
jgi:hypothetical protein